MYSFLELLSSWGFQPSSRLKFSDRARQHILGCDLKDIGLKTKRGCGSIHGKAAVIQVSVTFLSGRSFSFDLQSNCAVLCVMNRIRKIAEIPISCQKIICGEENLGCTASLGDYCSEACIALDVILDCSRLVAVLDDFPDRNDIFEFPEFQGDSVLVMEDLARLASKGDACARTAIVDACEHRLSWVRAVALLASSHFDGKNKDISIQIALKHLRDGGHGPGTGNQRKRGSYIAKEASVAVLKAVACFGDDEVRGALLNAMFDRNECVRKASMNAVVHLSSIEDPLVADSFARCLDDAKESVRHHAAESLQAVRSNCNLIIIEALLARFGDPSISVRRSSFKAFVRIARNHDNASIHAAMRTLQHELPHVRRLAISALASIGERTNVQLMQGLAFHCRKDKNRNIRRHAIVNLMRLADPSDYVAHNVLVEALTDWDSAVRLTAMSFLAQQKRSRASLSAIQAIMKHRRLIRSIGHLQFPAVRL